MKRICVYCGSNPGKLTEYREAARVLGHELAARNLGLVYGGASSRGRIRLGEQWQVSPSDELIQTLRARVGSESVSMLYR